MKTLSHIGAEMHQVIVAGAVVVVAALYVGFCIFAGKFCGFNDRTPE